MYLMYLTVANYFSSYQFQLTLKFKIVNMLHEGGVLYK